MFREDEIDDLLENTPPITLVCLCVDASSELSDIQKSEMKDGIERYFNAIEEDNEAFNSVDLCVISFGDSVRILREFSTLEENNKLPELLFGYSTGAKLNDAVELALVLLDERKQHYINMDIEFYQPELIIIGGSKPDDDTNITVNKIKELTDDTAITHFIFAVGEGDFTEDLNKLVVNSVGLQEVSRLQEYDFVGFYNRCSSLSEDMSDSISHEIMSDYEDNNSIEEKVATWSDSDILNKVNKFEDDNWNELPNDESVLILEDDKYGENIGFIENDDLVVKNSYSLENESIQLDNLTVGSIPEKRIYDEMAYGESLDDVNEFIEQVSIDSNIDEELSNSDFLLAGDEEEYQESEDTCNVNDDISPDEYYEFSIEHDEIQPDLMDMEFIVQKSQKSECAETKQLDLDHTLHNVNEKYQSHFESICEPENQDFKLMEDIEKHVVEAHEIEPYVMEPDILDENVDIDVNILEDEPESVITESDLESETEIPDSWTIAAQILNASSEKYGIKSDRISLPIDDNTNLEDDFNNWDNASDDIMSSISLYSESEDIVSSDISEQYEPEEVEEVGDELESWDNITYNNKKDKYGLEVIDMDSLTIKLRQLKLNKELLDSNAITIEEFEFVKRQILGDINRG